ncbi:hypothetical protein BJX63DRAFT_427224 [Aspergillus granulosus]|uniref:Uncharacterized protein n=1 Tax=Aspergillus granulosus TaxID=176169 RepID=A0ABR4I4H8_9EURO
MHLTAHVHTPVGVAGPRLMPAAQTVPASSTRIMSAAGHRTYATLGINAATEGASSRVGNAVPLGTGALQTRSAAGIDAWTQGDNAAVLVGPARGVTIASSITGNPGAAREEAAIPIPIISTGITTCTVRTSTSLSLQASNSNALSSIYASLTSSILAAASRTPDLDSIPTSTTTTVRSTTTTTTTRSTTRSTTTTTTTRPTDDEPPEEETSSYFPETSSDQSDPDFPSTAFDLSESDLFPTASGTDLPPGDSAQVGDDGAGSSIAPPAFTALALVSFIFMIVL